MTVTDSIPPTQKNIMVLLRVLSSVQDCAMRGPCLAVYTYVAHTLQYLKIQVLCILSIRNALGMSKVEEKSFEVSRKKIYFNNNRAHDCVLKVPYVRFRLQTVAVNFLKAAAMFMLE